MTKPELEKLVRQYNRAVAESLRRLRIMGEDGNCLDCGRPIGEQHSKQCAAWPIIEARAEYNKLMEAEKQEALL